MAVSTILLALLMGILCIWLLQSSKRRTERLPPGPPGLPFLGNFLQIPKGNEWIFFRNLGNTYGSDVVSLKVPGATVIVLNSRQAVADLLDSRSANYSDRPQMVMCSELVGFEDAVILSNNTPRFRTCRKLLRKGLGPGVVQSFIPFLHRQNAFFVEELVKDPAAYLEVARRNTARISMKIAYGYDGITDDGDMFAISVESNYHFSRTAVLGVWLVDYLPLLKHLPNWFPGAGFKRYAAKAKAVVDESVIRPFEQVKKHIAQGTAGASFCSMLLQSEKCDAELEYCIKLCANGIFEAQMDTTSSALSWFLLAMALHPDVQAKAQAEIDSVVGPYKLPELSDRDALPYTMAVMKEVFRWNPVVNLMPHAVTSDDEYRGYDIPAKSFVIANIWAIFHDESVYPNADQFIPERFLKKDTPDTLNVAFGFGRRTCPGMHIAHMHVFLTMATVLATLNITKAKDASGTIIEPEVESMPGAITFPKPFNVSILPRSDASAQLIRESAEHSTTLPDSLDAHEAVA